MGVFKNSERIDNRLGNPFPGLRPFEYDEYDVFFGRDGQTNELLEQLTRNRFVAVVGTSSSGKSSLVRASLLPSLDGGMMRGGGSEWRVAIMRPGGSPRQNLGQALDAAFGTTGSEITIASSSLGLVRFVRDASLQERERLLIVVDQFEELFRYASLRDDAEEEAAAFVQLLLSAVKEETAHTYVVLTLRSDFLGECARFWGLSEALNRSLYLVPRMFRDEFRQAIVGPIAVRGGGITEPLVNRLLNDVRENPDQLPLLQHALQRTWDYWRTHSRDNEPIGMEHYQAIGGLSEALGHHADEAFSELHSTDKEIAAVLFKALTGRDSANREYRRPTSVKELCEIAHTTPEQITRIIDVFRREGRAFLMPPAGIELTLDTVIDISHESFIRNWQQLNRWVSEEAASAQVYTRLAESAILKEKGQEDFYRGPALALALKWRDKNAPNPFWARRYNPDFETAMAFLNQSNVAHEESVHAETRRSERNLRAKRFAAVALVVLTLVSMSLASYSMKLRNESETRRLQEQRQAVEFARQLEAERAEAQRAMKEAVDRARLESRNSQAQRNVAR
jgi:hypothetical protein